MGYPWPLEMQAKPIFAIGSILALAAAARLTPGAMARPRARQKTKSGAVALAPPSAGAPGSLRSETRLITLDVSVRDRHGNPVRGLKASDFRVFDNGRGPQRIARFEFLKPSASPPQAVSMQATRAVAAKASQAPPVYSNQAYAHLPVPPTALLLDPGNIAFQDQPWAHRQALKLLDSLPAQTPVAVFLLEHGLTVVQNFTTDRAALRAAIDRSMIPLPQLKNPQSDPANQFRTSDTGSKATKQFQKLEYEEQTTVIADETSDAMRAIAKDLAGYPGQKDLVWISEAFPEWILPGSGFGPNSEQAGNAPLNDPFRQTFEASAQYGVKLASDARALLEARVTVYPLDARGLVAPALYDASGNMLAADPSYARNPASIGPAMGAELSRENTDLTFSQATMDEIARDTGGKACKNTNDLSGCAKAAIEDGNPDYEISYYPTGVRWDGSFHRITLKTDLHGVALRYRRGYAAIDTLELAGKQPLELFKQACASLLPVTSIGMKAEPMAATAPSNSRYLLSVSPAGLSVTPSQGKLRLRLRLGVCEFAPEGGRFRVSTRNFSRSFPGREARSWQSRDIQSVIEYQPRPDTKRLRLVVVDTSTGLAGSVDVPAHPQAFYRIRGPGNARESNAAELYLNLRFHSSNGVSSRLDFGGNEVAYRGGLAVDLAAPAFFHKVYGRKFRCQAGRLAPEDTHSAEKPNFRFAFRNSKGQIAWVNLAGPRPVYAGDLPVDASARAFFDRLWKLCHCEQP